MIPGTYVHVYHIILTINSFTVRATTTINNVPQVPVTRPIIYTGIPYEHAEREVHSEANKPQQQAAVINSSLIGKCDLPILGLPSLFFLLSRRSPVFGNGIVSCPTSGRDIESSLNFVYLVCTSYMQISIQRYTSLSCGTAWGLGGETDLTARMIYEYTFVVSADTIIILLLIGKMRENG